MRDLSCVAFAPSGASIAVVDGHVHLWSVATLEEELVLELGDATSFAFDPTGERGAAGAYDRIELWNLRTRMCEHRIEHRHGDIDAIAFSPHGTLFAAGACDDSATLWSVVRGACVHTTHHADDVCAVSFDPTGRYVATQSARDTKVTRLDDFALVAAVERGGEALAFTAHGHLDSIARDGTPWRLELDESTSSEE